MKKLVALLLMFVMLCLSVHATEIELYNLSGDRIIVQSGEVEELRRCGWYYYDEIYTTLYSEDGKTAAALNTDLEKWTSVGWHENIDEVQTTLYSEDGRNITVWNAEVEAYLKVGWYKTLEEVQTTLYSEDGRNITVWNAEVEAYLKVGWYKTLEEVQTTLYSEDGRNITVWNAEVEAYLKVGWSLVPIGINPDKPMIALTFDDGPGPYTDKILDCLEKYNAKATFFVVGNRIGSYSAQLKREAQLGMEIGCHSWDHTQLTKLSESGISSQVFNTNNKVKAVAGVYPATLRPPYGSYNNLVKSVSKAPIIMWSIDTLDWKTKNADKTYNAVMENVRDGDIILMHDIHSATADAAVRLIPALIDAGYQLVTVSELGYYKKGGLKAGTVYSRII